MNAFREREVAVVTGGASGIGAACARVLGRRGCRVVVADIQAEAARVVAEEVGGVAERMDVASEASVEEVAARIEVQLGPVGVLVNSAGVLQRPLPPEELDLRTWDEVLAVDLRGTYVASVAFGRRMARRGRGAIVNIASVVGLRSAPLHAYAPAKAAVIGMTECLAAEWGRSGVRVNAISPGYTRTPALQAAIDRGQRDGALLAGSAALGRLVEPEEVANAVAFLASDEAAAITGTNLPVDAGWLVAPSWGTYGGLRGSRA